MFQQERTAEMKEPLTVTTSTKLNGLLAAFDHLPAQIGRPVGTQWHLGRPNGLQQRRTANAGAIVVDASLFSSIRRRNSRRAVTAAVVTAVPGWQRQRMATGRHERFSASER